MNILELLVTVMYKGDSITDNTYLIREIHFLSKQVRRRHQIYLSALQYTQPTTVPKDEVGKNTVNILLNQNWNRVFDIYNQFPLYSTHPVMSNLQFLEFCCSSKKSIWELGQLVTVQPSV